MTRERIAALPAGDFRRRASWFQEPKLSVALRVVEELKGIAKRHGCSVAEAAIAWVLLNPAVTAAIVGARRPEQVDDFIGTASVKLSEEDRQAIDEAMTV